MFEIRPEGSEGAAMEISETRDPGKEQTQQLPVGCDGGRVEGLLWPQYGG